MATTIITEPRQASEQRDTTTPAVGPLVVATDGSPASDAAIHAAHAFASRTGRAVELVAVHVPIPVVAAEVQFAVTPEMELSARESLRGRVEEQRIRLRLGMDWPLAVVSGDPAATIVRIAKEHDASLIVMGIGGHRFMDRVLGDELVLRVLRLGKVPVFAAAAGSVGLPRRVVSAMDFSGSSVRALRCASELMPRGGSLAILHAVSRDMDELNWTARNAGYSGTIGRAFDRVTAEIGFGDGGDRIDIERAVVGGDPAREVLALAKRRQADLIVAGSHGFNFLTRLMLGSVSTTLVRTATCSVLVAPPEDGPDFIEELPKATTIFAFHEWAERLEEFTRSNAGRRATLEVIEPEFGAQIAERSMVLVGASFDPRDARVQIMLGSNSSSAHLTRSISGVTAIQVLRDRNGRHLLLRVAHGRGQTLLTLER